MQSPSPAKGFRIKKEIDQRTVRWGAVLDLLSSRHRMSYAEGNAILKKFLRRLDLLFNALWFVRPALSPDDNKLMLAACEVHGTDSLTLLSDRTVAVGPLSIGYHQQVQFVPAAGKGRERDGRCKAVVNLRIFKRDLRLETARQVIAMQTALFVFAVLSYAILVGALLHGFATFLVLLREPFIAPITGDR